MRYDLVLFDLDGTIADTELVLIQTMLHFIHALTPERKVTLNQLMKVSGPPLKETLSQYFPKHDVHQLANEFASKAREFYPRYAVAFPEVEELITALESEQIPFGIVTSKLKRNALFTLEVIGLLPRFPLVISLDDVQHPKPHPEGIQKALHHFKKSPQRTMFVGDTIYDYQAGKNAGVDVALVSWSLQKFSQDVQPRYWIQQFSHFKEWLLNESL